MKSIFTRVTYMYRDASNYKFWSEFVLDGKFDVKKIQPWLVDKEFFIPKRIGLKMLTPKCRNEDDHDLHTIVESEPCEAEPAFCSATEFYKKFEKASKEGWFISDSDRPYWW